MPSTKSIACAVATAGYLASTANAFWLIPGTHKTHQDSRIQRDSVIPASYLATANDLKETVQDQYNKFTGKHDTETEKTSRSIVRALQEVGIDIGSQASQAKSALSSGMYFRENEDLYLLAVDIPGLHTREVEIITDRNTLTIKGERKCSLKKKEAVDPLCIDRSFDASFTFPSDADQDKTDGRLDAGVVYVTVPKLKGEQRGVGRILKLTGDAAEWVYESTGAKIAYDAAAGTASNAADKVQDAAAAAKDATYGAAAQARDAAQDTANNVLESANHAVNQARDVADRAANTVVDTANQARDTAYEAANKARDAAYEAANKARDAAYNAKDSGYEAANKARDAAYEAANSARDAAYNAAGDAKNKANEAAGNAKVQAKQAKEQAEQVYDNAKDGEQRKGFVENIKRMIVGPGSSEGKVPVVEKAEL